MKVVVLIEALALVGRSYRSKDGSQPAEAVKKVLRQFEGAEAMTLAEWAESRQRKPASPVKKTAIKRKADKTSPDQALKKLKGAHTQGLLREAIADLTLSPADWKSMAKNLTGRSGSSGKAAREAVETYFSDRLLLEERVESVRRQFG